LDSIATLTLYNTIIVILSFILMVVVWRMSHQPSRYVFAAIQALIIVLMASYTFDVSSSRLDEKLFFNNFEYLSMVFIPTLVLVIAFQLSGRTSWLTTRRLLPLFGISSFFYLSLATNNYHHLFYVDVMLASDPLYSFVTVRGPMFYAFFLLALSELIIASLLIWQANRESGLAQKRRTTILIAACMCPTAMTFVGILTEMWIPSEMLVITGILLSSVLLFVGTFGFEMFRLLPFTFDGTVKTLKDGVLIVDEHQILLYANPALPELIGLHKENDLSGKTLKDILPGFPFRLLDDKVSSENQEAEEIQMLPGRFYDIQVSKIHNRKHTTISSLVIIKEVTERKRLEEDGRQSRELYTKIFQSSPAALVLSRLDNGKLIEVNEMFVKVSGFSRNELIDHTTTELNLWGDTEDRDRLIDLARSNGVKRNIELKYRRKDGTLRTCNASPQRIELDNVHCMLTVIEDITEQLEIEERVRSNEEKFRTLFDYAGDGIYIADMKGSIIDANGKALDRLGFEHDELVGKGFAEFIAPEDIPQVVAGLQELWAKGSTFRELNGLSKQGKRIPAEINARTINISGRKALLIISRDTTERKEGERALRNEKERLDVTLNSISEGVIVTDMEGRAILANNSAAALLNVAREAIVGMKLDEIYHLGDTTTAKETSSAIMKTLKDQAASTTYRVTLRTDAHDLLINESASPIFEGEKMVGAVLAFHDVTAEKNLEEEISKAARLRTIGTLAGGIAHDFNNVLTIIMGNIELTRRSGASSIDPEKWFDDISKALERATELSNQLLTFSKGGAPVKRDIALSELITEAVSDISVNREVQVEVKIPENLGKVNIDEGQMKQALMHILKNAREAMPDGGLLEISAVRSFIDGESIFLSRGEYIHVKIRDSGSGIPSTEVNHVFEPYFTTKQDHPGMGLAVAYSIVKAHNGHISIESDVEKGTIVHIYLPSMNLEKPEEKIVEKRFPQKSHLKVLVMDDETMIRELATEMLDMLGHKPESVYGGEQALERYAGAMASGDPYDLVVMDLTIPNGMGGKEAIVELLKLDPAARVIVSSGYSNDPVMGDFRKFGFSYVMPKPYKMRDFELAIEHAMTDISSAR
jgi:PAS domain S-box-containing protein